MILPYAHSGLGLSRIPWATIAIIGICVLAYGLTGGASDREWEIVIGLLTEIDEAYTANPSLEIDPRILEHILQSHRVDENQREVFLELLAERAARNPMPGAAVTQQEFDRLTIEYWNTLRSSPDFRLGLVPAAITPWGLITHQFMHGGWVHLISNMMFLFLAGPYLEQRWGRALFVGFYLSSGVVAALAWAARNPELEAPLIGASGAVAGLMGAFLICFGAAKIRFFYWYLIAWGTFEAPAWLVLPLWFAREVVSGRQTDLLQRGEIAHWAHVWGFIFGMVVAWGLGVIGLDRRLAERELAAASGATPERRRTTSARVPGPPARATAAWSPAPDPAAGADLRHHGRLPEPPNFAAAVAGTAEPASPDRPAVELRPAELLKVLDGVPAAIDGTTLRFAVSDARRALDLRRVEAVAVGAIAQPGGRPFLVVDLLLDPPWDSGGDLRLLRLRSSSFDPRTIVGGEQPMEAFTRLLNRLLVESSAVPLPDAERLRSPGSVTYASIDEYQEAVLGVVDARGSR